MMKGKKLLIGITASIAAYKIALLIRILKKAGAEVQVIMTPSAFEFIPPLTLATLSEKPVLSEFVKDQTGTWNNHVDLGLWADLMLIAPASANTLAKMAHGLCDNLLLATYLSARCPVAIAPAMDLDMYAHPTTQQNLQTLQSFGHLLIDAEVGPLASGLEGKGRMAEPEHIFRFLEQYFTPGRQELSGKKVLITAGPTREYIDPVRYISNGSTGKMGFALAKEFAANGADVTVVCGPTEATPPSSEWAEIIPVTTAHEMYEATLQKFEKTDIAVFTAAVSDYTPKQIAPEKIKKDSPEMNIKLVKSKDIAKEMGLRKQTGQLTIGFALETQNEEENARGKLQKKNLDFVVLNSLRDQGAGFGYDTNQITIIDSQGTHKFELKSKDKVAKDIVTYAIACWKRKEA
ncbi:bifunctional phosphopantothenoylcysteine decarboxylase/phosphopantothenate--cysteine ligase CoaBC [Rapidithrix thailandica]|uniref:Coenzyme A biosynthesis bifunctional protein CoaBC n=1 Tax=Rapidithrix thailandica TaxID=413964 RepID=A0AAW9SDL5_9BACT